MLSYHLCVHSSSTFNFLQKLSLCIHNLAYWHKRLSFWPISAFDMPFSLSLITSSFWFKVRDGLLPFTWKLTGHCRVNWSNFNIFASQRTGRLEEMEKDGIMAMARAHSTFIKLVTFLYRHSLWCPKTITVVTSNISYNRNP